jgi:hypothetical protein
VLPFEDRYTRQRQLPEVGAGGQELLARSEAAVCADAAGRVQQLYLERAGVERFEPAPGALPFPHASHFRFVQARAIAEGSWRALAHVRRCLALTAQPHTAGETP